MLSGAGKGKPGSEGFEAVMKENPSISFYASVEELPHCEIGSPHLFLIAGRTVDAQALFVAAIAKGATHVYMEKPGATSAEQLSEMRDLAAEQGVAVVVGYNKNVAEYSRDALAALRKASGAGADGGRQPRVTLEHCNEFTPGEGLVAFMRGPGGEGMLHNMCCHELALATTLFGVTCARVRKVVLEPESSKLIALDSDSGSGGRADWQKLAFWLELAPATTPPPLGGVHVERLHFSADRCGGNFSRIRLTDEEGVVSDFRLPSAEHEEWVLAEQARDKEIRPYFLQQAPDYKRLKGDFVAHILSGAKGIPEGVVGLDGAIEALKLADLLKPTLEQCSKDGAPWTVRMDAAA